MRAPRDGGHRQFAAVSRFVAARRSSPHVVRRCRGVLTLKSLLFGVSLTVSCCLLLVARAPEAASAEVPAQNSVRGKVLFLRCASCHDVTAAASAKIGPNLRGVIGRQVASLEGYRYSAALKAQNFVWDTAHLDAWLTNPNALAPGTAMAFAGIPEAADRQAIIGYLETQGAGSAP
jgi:cytochrome c